MIEVSSEEAKTQLDRLLLRVEQGEEVIIAEGGKPIARLVPYLANVPRRIAGRDAGKIHIAPDFNDPLPEEILDAFER